MEQSINKEPNKKNRNLLIVLISLLIISVAISLLIGQKVFQAQDEIARKDSLYNNTLVQINSTNEALNIQTKRADSVSSILHGVNKYMPMVSTLQYRDSVSKNLPYKPGDIVLLKPDSSKWVITSIILKGGKWQHTVVYNLRDKTGKQIEVEPETLY